MFDDFFFKICDIMKKILAYSLRLYDIFNSDTRKQCFDTGFKMHPKPWHNIILHMEMRDYL